MNEVISARASRKVIIVIKQIVQSTMPTPHLLVIADALSKFRVNSVDLMFEKISTQLGQIPLGFSMIKLALLVSKQLIS